MASPTPVTGSSSSTPSPNPNMRMRAIVTRAAGRPEVLEMQERDIPLLQADEVLIKVAATCTNKIDLIERKEQANVILGHECSGHIVDVGANVTDWQINEPVCALLRGSGYAEFVAVPSSLVFRIPRNISVELAASLPFLTCSTFQAILDCEKLKDGTMLLIHDGFGFGELGIFAMRVAKALYNTQVFVVSDDYVKLRRYKHYGADNCINSADCDFPVKVDSLTMKRGVDLILNYGGADVIKCQQCLARWGFMMVAFDVQEKRSLKLSIYELRDFSTTIKFCDLRQFVSSSSGNYLSAVVEKVKEQVWPLFEEGRLKCEPPRMVMPLSDAATAHKRMEKGMDEKIMLTLMEEEKPQHEWKLTSLFTNMWAKFGSLLGERAPAGEQTNSTTTKRKRE